MSVRKITSKISEEEKKEICVRTPTLDDVFVEYYFLHYSDAEQWGLEKWRKEWRGFAKRPKTLGEEDIEENTFDIFKTLFMEGDTDRFAAPYDAESKLPVSVFEEIIKPEVLRIRDMIRDGGPIRMMEFRSAKNPVLYKDAIYAFDRDDYTDEEILLQILDFEDKERRKFEQLKRKVELSEQVEKTPRRETIPEEVRIAVWRRDDGKCAKCGGRTNLEYDHIIPVSRGGSNTLRNIELLCEECNRRKKDNIE